MKFSIFNFQFSNSGFTLIEIMIAISVMTTGVVGIYALIPFLIEKTAINTDRFVASQLATDGIELVRNIRDTNWLGGFVWDTGLTGCLAGCEIDYNDGGLLPYQERFLKIDTDGFYNYETGQNSKFKRKITITPYAEFLNVKVQMLWSGKGSPLEIEENFYDWR